MQNGLCVAGRTYEMADKSLLVKKTQKLFSKRYGRVVSKKEAREIGRNLGQIGRVILKSEEKETQDASSF